MARRGGPRPVFFSGELLTPNRSVAISVVTMPVVIAVLPTLMFPPFVPAALPLFAQFVAPVIGLAAVVAVMLDRFVQLPLRAIDSPIAILPMVRFSPLSSSK